MIVGGAGAMGQTVASTAAGFDEVTELVILDRDEDRAQALVNSLGSKAHCVRFDATDDDLTAHLGGVDAVVSTLGPFTIFGRPVLEAVLEAGCTYLDINDDWEPTVDVLKLDEAARKAGVTAVIGMGASPGVSNVLATRAVTELDEVHDLVTGWALAGTTSPPSGATPSAAAMHLVHQCTGTIQAVENGRSAQVRPLQLLRLDYPNLGPIDVRTVGHPEAITLPRRFPGLRRCVNVMAGPGWWFDRLATLMDQVDTGALSMHDAACTIERGFAKPVDSPRTLHAPGLWAWARGLREGQQRTAAVGLNRWPPGEMAGATGIPAAVVLQMLLRREVSGPGVVTPEDVVPFDLLMERLDPYYQFPVAGSVPLFTVVAQGGHSH
ncbi:saccharopine dehydrogenase family protein [Rhodococcus wratislaviensis]|uniref:saccharopine dehydrogenase family protein n=1 Tax=Rhodococcus wratislaviensis TaxID=44752 RepID=UPI00351433CF